MSNPCAICHKVKFDSAQHFVILDDSPLGFHIPDKDEIEKAIFEDDIKLDEKKICDECVKDS